jgi:hypothetical protein
MTENLTTSDTEHPDQPDGIEDDSHDLPGPARAAERVGEFLSGYGDGLIGVEFSRVYCPNGLPPLYARDLEALRKLPDEVERLCAQLVRSVVLPDDWREQFAGCTSHTITKLIESWSSTSGTTASKES